MLNRILLIGLLVVAFNGQSQSDSSQIASTVIDFFEALREGNAEEMEALLHDSLVLCSTYRNGENEPKTIFESRSEFLNTVRSRGPELWDERIYNLEIRHSQDLGSAWMEYNFYLGKTFSHCGVNSFQLVRENGKWTIICILDTRDRSKCNLEKQYDN